MSIPLPALPLPSIDAWPNTLEKLRARDLEVARVVLEAAAKVCDRYTEGQWLAEQIRTLELKHHE